VKSRAAELRRSERRWSSSASDDEVGGFSMFAPPICRRRWRNNAFRFRQIRRRRRQQANIAASGSEQANAARLREQPSKRWVAQVKSRAADAGVRAQVVRPAS
jgi:hypothetical protein